MLEAIKTESFKEKLSGLDLEKFAQGYIEMSDINIEISNEYITLESEANYLIEKVIGTDE